MGSYNVVILKIGDVFKQIPEISWNFVDFVLLSRGCRVVLGFWLAVKVRDIAGLREAENKTCCHVFSKKKLKIWSVLRHTSSCDFFESGVL